MGMLLRLLFLAGIVWLIVRLVRGNPSPTGVVRTVEPPMMRQCRQCGIHIPETESTQSRGHFFCCEAHRDEFLKHQP